ncbi:hypothetical protein MKA38_09050 [[Clostridium] innocuum]|nr:hypothetical protein [[Clostridium] innocuum]
MDPDRLEKFMRKDHARISGFHAASYTKKLLRHLLWITVGVIVLILLTIITLQFLYDSVRLATLSLLLIIVLTITFLLYRRMRKAKQRKKMKEIIDRQSG